MDQEQKQRTGLHGLYSSLMKKLLLTSPWTSWMARNGYRRGYEADDRLISKECIIGNDC